MIIVVQIFIHFQRIINEDRTLEEFFSPDGMLLSIKDFLLHYILFPKPLFVKRKEPTLLDIFFILSQEIKNRFKFGIAF